jgi:hypothetical protein
MSLADKFNIPSSLLDLIKGRLKEETEYQAKVKSLMAKKGIKSLGDLSPEEKKEFFSQLDAMHQGQDEQVHPEDKADSSNKLQKSGTKKWLTVDYKDGKPVSESEDEMDDEEEDEKKKKKKKDDEEELENVDEACWDTHVQDGMKMKGGKMVPNCVPKNEASSPAQQAAIAIAMKKDGKKPKDMQEAPVGGGTSIKGSEADRAKATADRAKITMQAAQLRIKQAKEREALSKKKQSIKSEFDPLEESFSDAQIARLKAEYSKINTVDPSGDSYKKLTAMLDKLDVPTLEKLAGAGIKFVSGLAKNRVLRKSMKKEDVTEASQRVDSLVTDALKIMKGSELKDAVQALKTVLGDREYNDRRGHYNFYVKQLVDMYGKKTNEELSPKQKALDKNKNGKIDGSDLAKLRNEEDMPQEFKQGGKPLADKFKRAFEKLGIKADVKIKTVGNVSTNEAVVKGKGYDNPKNERKGPEGKVPMTSLMPGHNEKAARLAAVQAKGRLVKGKAQSASQKEEVEIDEAKSDYDLYHKDFSTAVQHAIKTAEKRGYQVNMDDWHDKVATGPRKPSEGKTNSYSITLMDKNGKPIKKALQMQVYNKGGQNPYELNMYIEEIQLGESDAYDKNVKPSDKPHDKEAAAKRAKLAALAARKKMAENDDKNINDLFAEAIAKKEKEATAKDKNKSVKSGDKLSGKQEPVEIQPELKEEK